MVMQMCRTKKRRDENAGGTCQCREETSFEQA
jgi:hypothetical protein